MMRFKFWEFQVEWFRFGGKKAPMKIFERNYNVVFNMIAQKEFIGRKVQSDL